MARGRSSRGNAHDSFSTPTSLTQLLSPSNYTPRPIERVTIPNLIRDEVQYVRQFNDRRNYHPEPNRYPGAIVRRAGRLNIDTLGNSVRSQVRPNNDVLPWRVAFADPKKVAVCVRRKVRREVLHALKLKSRAGKGGAPRRRNPWSGIRC